MSKHRKITAAELLAQLEEDFGHQALIASRDELLSDISAERAQEQQSLLDDLRAVGVDVEWVGQLLSTPNLDECVYPILRDHLCRPYSNWLLEWIGRAFGSDQARPIVWDALVQLVVSGELPEAAKNGVMASISQMARPSDLDTLVALITDQSIGPTRLYIVRNLKRSKSALARETLMSLLDDPDLSAEIGKFPSRRKDKGRFSSR